MTRILLLSALETALFVCGVLERHRFLGAVALVLSGAYGYTLYTHLIEWKESRETP